MRSPLYRARQFFRGLRAGLDASEIALVRDALSDGEVALFMAMERRDRRHSMDMLHWLRARTMPSRDLAAAALLHDVGKGALWVTDRIVFVLLGAVSGRLRRRVAARGRGRMRDALWRLELHAELGAARLAGVSSERVRWLVSRHTEGVQADVGGDGGDAELRWLRAADDAC